jgi:hypothetical protein
MSNIDKKLEQIQLQHEISELLRRDNGVSCHYDYHVNLLSDYETIKLNLLTYNKRHNEYMLLHTVKGSSSVDCLNKVMDYLKQSHGDKQYSYTVNWSKQGDDGKHTSYFVAGSKEEAMSKFLHEKDPTEYTFDIIENPVA